MKLAAGQYFKVRELLQAKVPGWPTTNPAIHGLAERRGWPRRDGTGRGRRKFEYLIDLESLAENEASALNRIVAIRSLPAAAAVSDRPAPPVGDPARLEGGRASHAAAAGEIVVKPGMPEYESLCELLWADWERATTQIKERARQDAAAALRVVEMIEAGNPKGCSLAMAASEHAISRSTLRGWFQKELQNIDPKDFAAALIDRRGRRWKARPTYDESLYTYYKSDYLRMDRPPRSACYHRAVTAAKARGVSDDQIAAEITLWRRLEREVSWQAIKFARYGSQALHRSYPAQTRDRSILHALECVNGDGYRWNSAVVWPDGEIVRPLMWYWQDVYSGMILAWRLDKTENAALLRLTIGDLIAKYGIPDIFVIDNTLAASSKWITGASPSRHRFKIRDDDPFGLITQLGARHIATLPRVGGSSKPGERAGGDFDRDIARGPVLAGSWLGHNTAARPEAAREPVSLAKFIEAVRAGIAEHNSRPGRRTAVCKGRSFDEVFRGSFAKIVVRKPTAEQLRLCMLSAERVNCRKIDGQIELFGNKFWSGTTAALAGQAVVARFDPEKLQDGLFVYTLDGRFIGEAQCHAPVGFIDTAAAQQHNRLRRQNLKHHKAIARNAKTLSAIELAAMLPKTPEPEPAASNNVRRLFRHTLEQPGVAAPAPAGVARPADDLRAQRRKHRIALENIGNAAWTEEDRQWAAVFDAGVLGDDPLHYDDSFWKPKVAVDDA